MDEMSNPTNGNPTTAVAKRDQETAVAAAVEQLVIMGDLSQLKPAERVSYYKQLCAYVGVDWVARPFDYLTLDNKLVLYANQNCASQLRDARKVSVKILSREVVGEIYVVTALATLPDGRSEEATGAVSLVEERGEWKTAQSGKKYFVGSGEYVALRGKDYANAIMKSETKAKRRATFALCGLGAMADEAEGQPVDIGLESGEIQAPDPRDADPLQTPKAASARFHTAQAAPVKGAVLPTGRVFISPEDVDTAELAPPDESPTESTSSETITVDGWVNALMLTDITDLGEKRAATFAQAQARMVQAGLPNAEVKLLCLRLHQLTGGANVAPGTYLRDVMDGRLIVALANADDATLRALAGKEG